jgi:hypothetical protein
LPLLFLFGAWASGVITALAGNIMGLILWAGSVGVTCALYEWTAGKKYDAYISGGGKSEEIGPGVLIAIGAIAFIVLLVLINFGGRT